MAIVAKENNQKLSDLFEINDTYTAFCVDELCTYLYQMRGEKTYIDKIIEQNETAMNVADRIKN